MRVWHSRGHVELERIVVGETLLADLDDSAVGATGLHNLLGKDWLQRGIKLFSDVLKQNPLAVLDCDLYCTHKVGVSDLYDVNALQMLLGQVLDEFIGLVLRVDHKGPAACLIDDYAVLGTVVVLRQLSDVPRLNLDWVAQESSHIDSLGVVESHHLQLLRPYLLQLLSVYACEWPTISHHSC